MSDDVRRLFERLDAAPSDEFVASLRGRVLDAVRHEQDDAWRHASDEGTPLMTIQETRDDTRSGTNRPPSKSPVRRTTLWIGVAAVLIAVVGVAFIVMRTIDDDAPADSIPAPTKLALSTTFEDVLVFQTMSGGSNLWVVGNGSTFLLRIDPTTGAEAERITLPAAADLSWMETYKGKIYIPSQAGVMVLDDETGEVTGPKVASDLGDAVTLAFTDDAAWVFRFDKGNGRLEKWDQQLESMELSVDLGVQNPAAMVGVGDSLYLASDDGLQHYGPDGTLVATIPDIFFSQDMMVSSNGDLWVADDRSGEVVRIDTATDTQIARIRVGGRWAHSVWVTDESVWVTTKSEDTLSVIDPATNKVTATKLTLDEPRTLTLFDGRVWVAGKGWLQSFSPVSD